MRLPVVSVLLAIAFSVLPAAYVAQPVLTVAGQECAGATVLKGDRVCNCPTERTTPVQAPILLAGDVSVRGYPRRDGTYVQAHMRSAPDCSCNNNWSTYANISPSTGRPGTNPPRLYDGSSGYGSGLDGHEGSRRAPTAPTGPA